MSRIAFLIGILCLVAVHAAHLKSNGHPRAQAQVKSYIYIYIYPRSAQEMEYTKHSANICPSNQGLNELQTKDECRRAFVQLTNSSSSWYFRERERPPKPFSMLH